MKRIPIKLTFLIIAVLLCGSLLAGCAPGAIVDYFGTTAKMHYSKSEFTSFAVMESVEFLDGIYTEKDSERTYLIAKCTVKEDYYGNLAAGEEVYVPILTTGVSHGECEKDKIIAEIRDIFDNSDHILAHLHTNRRSDMYIGDVDFRGLNVSGPIVINDYDVIPINDGKLDIARVDRVYDNLGIELDLNDSSVTSYIVRYTYDFEDYFRNGMSEEELENAITRLMFDRVVDSSYGEFVCSSDGTAYVTAYYSEAENLEDGSNVKTVKMKLQKKFLFFWQDVKEWEFDASDEKFTDNSTSCEYKLDKGTYKATIEITFQSPDGELYIAKDEIERTY